MKKADIGLIGLAVMGENLVLNMESKGFRVAIYNRTASRVDDFMGPDGRGKGKKFNPEYTLKGLVSALERPRKVMMLVKAGAAVDDLIEQLIPLLEPGDVIIDGGNTHFPDTIRRTKYVESKGLLYIGTGVSGGEEGALLGPSMMPGGSPAAWPLVKPIFQSISAKVDGEPCCDWVGTDGAGHFVKMVHNGIEYGDMQLICEAYQIMRDVLGMTPAEMSEVFGEWNRGELDSYLIEITRDILAYRDADGEYVVDRILDAAGQKGTGKWTGISALELGVPLTLIAESVFARCLSSQKEERMVAAERFTGPETVSGSAEASDLVAASSGAALRSDGQARRVFLEDLRQALYASKIVSYAQGYLLMREAAKEYNWALDYGSIAMMWRGGCIIRSAFLGKIKEAFDREPGLSNLLLDKFFGEKVQSSQGAWRRIVGEAVAAGVPVPSMAAALTYFDGYRCKNLPANLLQAQRDYFGAHTYERIDRPRGEFFHTNWTGRGGTTASSAYNV
uniref:phosphogluconate dehydrogenase (NADP(+)-dependent, decarboxylating) n=2 Tax=termite gut metagenome TaxID=433724 RepID=S0DDL1_9ZZZZ